MDVGCDTGNFLRCAAELFGIVPVGIDVSRRAIRAAAKQGIEAHQTEIERAPESLSDFQVITAIDLIEHVVDPGRFLEEIRKRLRPGGVAYLETPNINSMVYRIGRHLCRLAGGRPASIFERLFPLEHLQYFTLGGFCGLAETAGLQVLRSETRVLPSSDISASLPLRAVLAGIQMLDRLAGQNILICMLLRRPKDCNRGSRE